MNLWIETRPSRLPDAQEVLAGLDPVARAQIRHIAAGQHPHGEALLPPYTGPRPPSLLPELDTPISTVDTAPRTPLRTRIGRGAVKMTGQVGIGMGLNLGGAYVAHSLGASDGASELVGHGTGLVVETGLHRAAVRRTAVGQVAARLGYGGQFARLGLRGSTLAAQGVMTVTAAGIEGLDAIGLAPEWAGGDGLGVVGWSDESEWTPRTYGLQGVATGLSHPVRSSMTIVGGLAEIGGYVGQWSWDWAKSWF